MIIAFLSYVTVQRTKWELRIRAVKKKDRSFGTEVVPIWDIFFYFEMGECLNVVGGEEEESETVVFDSDLLHME